MKSGIMIIVVAALLFSAAVTTSAQETIQVNYQGRLTDRKSVV